MIQQGMRAELPLRCTHRPPARQSSFVKYLRTIILVLLTVLLPIRGAVAAAMLCPGGMGTSSAIPATAQGHHHDMHAAQDLGANESATHNHSHAHVSDDSSSDAHAGACQFCAGGCCVTPLAFAPPSVESPIVATSAAFPAITARVSAHYPDGQDRPPRTI